MDIIELTEQEKDRYAKRCGYSEERYTDKVKEGVKQSEYDKDKENAIHRKTLKVVIDHIIYGTPISETDIAEFLKYYDDIENIKTMTKDSLNVE